MEPAAPPNTPTAMGDVHVCTYIARNGVQCSRKPRAAEHTTCALHRGSANHFPCKECGKMCRGHKYGVCDVCNARYHKRIVNQHRKHKEKEAEITAILLEYDKMKNEQFERWFATALISFNEQGKRPVVPIE